MQRMLILKLVSESFNVQDNIKNIILLKYYIYYRYYYNDHGFHSHEQQLNLSLIIQNTACVLLLVDQPLILMLKPMAVLFNPDSVQK